MCACLIGRPSIVEQGAGALAAEGFEVGFPPGDDVARVVAGLQPLHRFLCAHQANRLFQLEIVRVEARQGGKKLDAEAADGESVAVGEHQAHALAGEAGVDVFRGREAQRLEAHAGNLPRVQVGRQFFGLHPGRAEKLEGRVGAAADRDSLPIGRLGVELLAALARLYPEDFKLEKTIRLVGSKKTIERLQAGDDPRDIVAGWEADLEAFRRKRARTLLYD